MRKINFFLFHMLIGTIILFLAFKTSEFILSKILIFTIVPFFTVALIHHFNELQDLEEKKLEMKSLKILIGAFLASAITWYINHELGFGPIIANGFIGIVASILFPKEAGAYYVASFIGMSSQAIVSSMMMSGIIGVLAGFVIIFSQEIYNGVGGKGGTIAAFSTKVFNIIVSFFI